MRANYETRKRKNPNTLERTATAIELRKAGASYADIGRTLNISGTQAMVIIRGALSKLAQQESRDARVLRQLSIERFDRLLRAVWPRAMQGDCDAVRTAAYVERQRNELYGLNSPAKVQVEALGALKIVWSEPPKTEQNEGGSAVPTFDSSVKALPEPSNGLVDKEKPRSD